MSVAIVIPARYDSSRLPGKPLLRQTGKYLVQHVYERACAARAGNPADTVPAATADTRIQSAVHSFGGAVVLTRRDHPSGTDRVAEVARTIDHDVIVNLQGDEPLIDPAALNLLIDLLQRTPDAGMATLAGGLSSHRPDLVDGVGLIVGIDRFMSEARALTNFSGNAVATVLIGSWTGGLDRAKLDRVLAGDDPFDETTMLDHDEAEILEPEPVPV